MTHYKLNITRALVSDGGTQYPANNAKSVRDYALECVFDKNDMWREHVYLIFVNAQCQIEGYFLLGIGGTSAVLIDKRVACIAMLGANAQAAVLVHNHPSGDPRPSQSDIKNTEDVSKAFKAIGCSLLDHVIISDEKFYSFNDN